ncbi:hypothetical protein ACWCQW_47820 [Streptomyces mirabilis]
MLLVTLVQATDIAWRALDIDDAALNTTGALVGCLRLGRRLGRTVRAHAVASVTGATPRKA